MPTVEDRPRVRGRWKAVVLLPVAALMFLSFLMPVVAVIKPEIQHRPLVVLTDAVPRKRSNKTKSIPDMIRAVFGSRAGEALRVANCESNYDPNARSSSYLGVFQINQRTHSWRIEKVGGKDLFDPMTNIRVAHSLHRDKGWGPWTCARMLGIIGGRSSSRSRIGGDDGRTGRSPRNVPVQQYDVYPSFTYNSGSSGAQREPRMPRKPGMST